MFVGGSKRKGDSGIRVHLGRSKRGREGCRIIQRDVQIILIVGPLIGQSIIVGVRGRSGQRHRSAFLDGLVGSGVDSRHVVDRRDRDVHLTAPVASGAAI